MAETPSWADRPWEKPSDDARDAGSGQGAPRKSGCLLGCLGVTALVIVVAVSCSLSGDGDGSSLPTSYEAERQCQEWLRNQLRAPSTAEFSETSSTGGPTSWTVSGVVDAENAFGAMLRSAWTCDIRIDGDTWRGAAVLLE